MEPDAMGPFVCAAFSEHHVSVDHMVACMSTSVFLQLYNIPLYDQVKFVLPIHYSMGVGDVSTFGYCE